VTESIGDEAEAYAMLVYALEQARLAVDRDPTALDRMVDIVRRIWPDDDGASHNPQRGV
jgi:hypothetical protein